MSAKIVQFYNRPKASPIRPTGQLPLVTASVLKSNERHEQNDLTSLEDRQETYEADRYRFKHVQANLSALALLKIAETKEVIGEWIRESQIGDFYTNQYEPQAVAIIELALAKVDAAEEAILDAAVAHVDEFALNLVCPTL